MKYAILFAVLILFGMAALAYAGDVVQHKKLKQGITKGVEETDVNITINTGDDATNNYIAKLIASLTGILVTAGGAFAAFKKFSKKADATKST